MPAPPTQRQSNLIYRILSAIVLAVAGILILYFGGAALVVFCIILMVLMGWELINLGREAGHFNIRHCLMALASTLALLAAYFALWWVLIISVSALIYIVYLSTLPIIRPWAIAAVLAIGFASYSAILVRDEFGIWAMIWLLGCVIVTDIGGYLFGRTLGGPKLWPAISPKKTWAGTIGGWGLSIALSMGFVFAFDFNILWLGIAGFIIAISSQIGDLFFSALKRKVSQKDYGAILPGHGGILDRFDGMVAANALIGVIIIYLDWFG